MAFSRRYVFPKLCLAQARNIWPTVLASRKNYYNLGIERKNLEAFLVLELCLLLYMINNDKKIQRVKLDVQNTNPLRAGWICLFAI